MDKTKILYQGQVGSRLYNCHDSTSDIDNFLLMPKYYVKSRSGGEGEDYFIYSPEVFKTFLFADNICYDQYLLLQECIVEDLFSAPVGNIHTPLNSWIIANRQLILDSNRQFFGKTLLLKNNNLLNSQKQLYELSSKTFVQAIINLQLYINYAELNNNNFISAQKLLSEQNSKKIKQIKQGLIYPADLYCYFLDLNEKITKYSDFWNIPRNQEAIFQLSEDMQDAINQSYQLII